MSQSTNTIWITGSPNADEAVTVYFRREFTVNALPAALPIRVSADARYRLQLNGEELCCGPCKGDAHVRYCENIDLSPRLKIGRNVLAARVIRYRLSAARSNVSVWQGTEPFFHLAETGEEKLGIGADSRWRWFRADGWQMVSETVADGFNLSYLYNSEIADGRMLPANWELPGFDDSGWSIPTEFSEHDLFFRLDLLQLQPRPIPLLPEIPKRFPRLSCVRESDADASCWERLLSGNPLTLVPHSEHIVELDACELETGYYALAFEGGRDSTLEITCAESYLTEDSDGRLVKKDRTDAVNGVIQGYRDRYTVGGFGSENTPERYSPFWLKTFRFVQLRISVGDTPLTLSDLCFRETGYPLEVRTEVVTDSPTMNAIYDICLRSLKRCMQETYIDCPYYEQLQYAMDTRAQILFTYAVAADDRMARRTIDDFHRSIRPDGLINCCYPTKRTNVIPGFSLYYLFMLHDHMMYFGDRAFLERYWTDVEIILDYFARRTEKTGLPGRTGGIISRDPCWSFIDWAPEYYGGVPTAIRQGGLTMESLLVLMAVQMSAELADFIGRPDRAAAFRTRASRMKTALWNCCYDSERGLFQDGPGFTELFSEHPQIFAVLTGLVTGEQAAALLMRMENYGKQHPLARCTVAMSFYQLRAYELAGLYDRTKPLWAPWEEMLRNHMTTCLENPTDGRSDCHAWGAAALYELPSVILGVRPAAPGYSEAVIAPNPGWLNRAEGTVCTPRGSISVKVRRDSDGTVRFTADASSYTGKIIR